MFSADDLKKRGLIFTGRFLPYNPDLIQRAKELRKRMTSAERKLWLECLRKYPHRVLSQHPIDNYIVDFYCPALKLVIEIDGEQHYSEEGKVYDTERDGILSAYGLKVLRLKNEDVMEDFESVCKIIEKLAEEKIPPPHKRRPPY
ncbi:MAG: endonuclease domain-containing protein [Candidatus Latescibacter sp.]|nr:endonuclease domain-containing protein [Candidatus Latescibacter sp.]